MCYQRTLYSYLEAYFESPHEGYECILEYSGCLAARMVEQMVQLLVDMRTYDDAKFGGNHLVVVFRKFLMVIQPVVVYHKFASYIMGHLDKLMTTFASTMRRLNIPCDATNSFTETFMEMDLMGAVHYGLVSVIFTFTVVELFDNIGTLIGVSRSAGLMDKDGKIENIDRALLTDSCGTMFSAIMGTCTVTSYVESTAGTNAGGRTGLTAVVVGICFILAIVFAPLAGLVPGFATAPALIIVGAMMMKNVLHVNFDDYSDSIPAFLTIVMMPLSYSIANGFGFGFTSFCLLKCLTGKRKEITPVMWVVTIVFMISFALH